MPPDPKASPPAPPAPQGGQGGGQGAPQGGGQDARLSAVEAEQKRQGGMLEQILQRLPAVGGGPGPAPSSSSSSAPQEGGKSVGQLVREGIAELEAERARTAKEADADKARKDHADRIKKLEERVPAETAATPTGRLRAAVQRGVFGIDDPHR